MRWHTSEVLAPSVHWSRCSTTGIARGEVDGPIQTPRAQNETDQTIGSVRLRSPQRSHGASSGTRTFTLLTTAYWQPLANFAAPGCGVICADAPDLLEALLYTLVPSRHFQIVVVL